MNASSLPFSAAAERNQAPLLDALGALLPARARVLEIASGTGQHAAYMAAANGAWSWQPTEGDAQWLAVIAARCRDLANVSAPLALEVAAPWPVPRGAFDAIFCANLLHISPWPNCAALMRGAAAHLSSDGVLAVYGPFIVDGEATASGNLAFDADLRRRDARWGLRRLGDVEHEATQAGLRFDRRIDMPANNLLLVFRGAAIERR